MNSIRIIAFVIAACAAFCASTADAKKPHLPLKHQVTPVTDQQVDEEEQMTFLEKRWTLRVIFLRLRLSR